MPRKLTLLLGLWLSFVAQADEPNYFLVAYSPGASWNEAISYEDQPGLKQHHEYVRRLHLDGQVLMAGSVTDINEPFLGLLLLQTDSMEQAERLASQDPGVLMRLLRVDVIPWHVSLSSMRQIHRRSVPAVDDPEKSFSIKRFDPGSSINLEE